MKLLADFKPECDLHIHFSKWLLWKEKACDSWRLREDVVTVVHFTF